MKGLLIMITMNHVTKRFGMIEAVHDLSFSLCPDRIIGLLGQNGAGKSTTLNLLTGYYPATSGQILYDGMDLLTHPRDCKRRLGYIPEQPPLYDEMTVTDYLRFCCRLKEVLPRSIPAHVDDILQLCGLTEVRKRILGNLSKGYRQRAAIAQALCGDPSILIMDEPTVGLDPRQVVEIRELIRKLGETHTVLFSSHLLTEVEQLCSQVVVLHHGKLIRDFNLSDTKNASGKTVTLRASIAMNEKQLVPALKSLPCFRRIKVLPTMDTKVSEISMECAVSEQEEDPQTQLFRLLCGLNAPIRMLMQEQDSLESIFLGLTSGHAEEAEA